MRNRKFILLNLRSTITMTRLVYPQCNVFVFLQDILSNESIQLDWEFRISLINDIVQVHAITLIAFGFYGCKNDNFQMKKCMILFIMITCPCNEHPLTPHLYIEKVGFTRVYIFFLFLLQNIDCGYSLEPPR